MKVLVLGGIHGNERLGIDLVQSLSTRPISGVDSLIANPEASASNVRFVESDLNRSFGQQVQDTYETKRANTISTIVSEYDIVLDFHNTETPNNNCCFIGVDCQAELYDVAKRLDFTRVIEATYDCINKYCPNVISIEISKDDDLDSVEYWRTCLMNLVTENSLSKLGDLSHYRFLRRVSWSEQKKLGLSSWRPFEPLSSEDKTHLAVKGHVAPIFIGSRLTEFYATLITKTGEK